MDIKVSCGVELCGHDHVEDSGMSAKAAISD